MSALSHLAHELHDAAVVTCVRLERVDDLLLGGALARHQRWRIAILGARCPRAPVHFEDGCHRLIALVARAPNTDLRSVRHEPMIQNAIHGS